MKKLCVLFIFSLFILTGCSRENSLNVKNAKVDEIKTSLEIFVVDAGYSFSREKLSNYNFNIIVEPGNTLGQFFFGDYQDNENELIKDSGFTINLKQVNNDVLISSKSYGLGLRGIIFNKTNKFVKFLRAKGYKVEKNK